jgi:tRNA A37 threonylcarbamoyltransferase TsaD
MDAFYLGIETSCDDTSCAIFTAFTGTIVGIQKQKKSSP